MRSQRMTASTTASTTARSGFTLVEMLMVIGIIAILMAMLLPTVTKARASGRNVVCQSNMRQIYQGQQLWRTANKAEQELSFSNWRGTIAQHLGSSDVWACAEDENLTGQIESAWFNLAIRVKGFNYEDLGYSLELHEGPFCIKVGQGADAYELRMEDILGGGDMDMDDVVVSVRHVGNGKFDLRLTKGSAGYHFDLIDTLTGQIIKVNFGDDGQPVTIDNAEGGKLSYGMVGHNNPLLPTQHINVNYGNSQRIYFMDYPLMQVIVAPASHAHNWTDPYFRNAQGELKFARHKGKINAMMGDGHTESFTKQQIDLGNLITNSKLPSSWVWKLGERELRGS